MSQTKHLMTHHRCHRETITGVAEGSVSIEVESSDGQYYDFYIIYVNE